MEWECFIMAVVSVVSYIIGIIVTYYEMNKKMKKNMKNLKLKNKMEMENRVAFWKKKYKVMVTEFLKELHEDIHQDSVLVDYD